MLIVILWYATKDHISDIKALMNKYRLPIYISVTFIYIYHKFFYAGALFMYYGLLVYIMCFQKGFSVFWKPEKS